MKRFFSIFVLIFSFGSIGTPISAASQKPELAIVIDDLGNNMKGTKEMMELPVTLTAAIMPFMPTTKEDAELANKNGHEVIVHMPMEPKRGKRSWLGPGAITTDLTDEEIRSRVESAIKEVPHAVGMNHHMGSRATENERVMRVVLEVCKEHGLFYLDSKTTGKSVVGKLANEIGVPYVENNIFFDDIYTTAHITKQADRLAEKLVKNERIIAIGHVGITGTKMVSVLKEYIPVYKEKAQIVPLSELIPGYELIDDGP
ncbi:divergent polysaccharide deacetylase family protein [Cytobacillus firmus]|uniref:divergent polysaccharide deacetylase family protein n=1 Tax=Cytobacillus TaxID=2675230 RepID=UPI001100BA33|nr:MULTISPECIES: divergent polysaccharide deacetylase family protein [Cytobacillus]MBG9443626.1 sugar deacetylase [Cytobacillus firmus]MCC3646270.1 divergent polysaccharide deacetylase family protein [Cytobacillus oceanisediminis]MCU1803940.1 divergent polysaccharide deacetylase family protein [Cytobacillus firmus]USK41165.1 divergent polysaccharide deacetylase family protein [Cytobacillus firmus]WHY36441.1 divergent polysaccharide deacetylase family protein [Cytobacillus firmus]